MMLLLIHTKCAKACDTKESKKIFKQAVKRTANQLLHSHRIKRCKLGAGAPNLITNEDEQMIAKCIEEKATYHGRRHNTVMYTNRRVKSRDLLAIANHHRLESGRKPLNLQQLFGTGHSPAISAPSKLESMLGKAYFAHPNLQKLKT